MEASYGNYRFTPLIVLLANQQWLVLASMAPERNTAAFEVSNKEKAVPDASDRSGCPPAQDQRTQAEFHMLPENCHT